MTPEQIDTAQVFHENGCEKIEGTRGGVRFQIQRWRRNGRTQRWKRDIERFRIPIKFGLRDYYRIDPVNAGRFHAAEDCPVTELRY